MAFARGQAIFACLSLAAMAASTAPALAIGKSGFLTYQEKKDDPTAMSANDFAKILDNSLGDKFKQLVVVIGACYSVDFIDPLKERKAYKSGKAVALLASTDKNCRLAVGTESQGNSFLQGLATGLSPIYAPDGATLDHAFDTAKIQIERDDTKAKTGEKTGGRPTKPSFFPDEKTDKKKYEAAKNIVLGRSADSYHAILFSGQPTTCADWWDVLKTYDVLVESNYKPEDIIVLFGNGQRDKTDSTPVLADGRSALKHKQETSEEKKKKQEQNPEKGCPYDGTNSEVNKDGKTRLIKYTAASYKNFQAALEGLKQISEKSEGEQYFIWTASHNTTDAKDLITLAQPQPSPFGPRGRGAGSPGGEFVARPTMTVSPSPTATPLPVTFEVLGWGGGLSASSFGNNYDTEFWGGRMAARLATGQFRLQGDVQGERTSDYSPAVGNRGYFAGGWHLDWMPASNFEIGGFGGAQDAKTTFHGPESTNYFAGAEARYFLGPAVLGAQFGRFDVANGPGTLTNAWFGEARFRVSLGDLFHTPSLSYTTVGGELGYGSGTAAGANAGAQTTYWGLRLAQGFAGTPVSAFIAYEHFENRVDGLGQVWNENLIKGGVRMVLPGANMSSPIEPTQPLPFLLRAVTNF